MAVPSQRSQRFLQAIFHGRAQLPVLHPFLKVPTRRMLHVCCKQSKNVYPVSFGPETDELIEKYTDSIRKTTKPRRKLQSSRSSSTDQSKTLPAISSIEITPNDEHGEILATRPPARTTRDTSDHADSASLPTAKAMRDTRRPDLKKSRSAAGIAKINKTKQSPSSIPTTGDWQYRPPKRTEPWQIQKDALEKKFGEATWNPRKKLSPDAIQGLRDLHAEDPERYSTPILADRFKVSPEAIRRILKSKWRASSEEMEDRRQRWARRHDRIWDHKAALGQRPQRQRDKVPDGPEVFDEELRAKQMLGQI